MTRGKFTLLVTAAMLSLCLIPSNLMAQYSGTLYSPNKYLKEKRDICLNFQTGLSQAFDEQCDLKFGLLGINKDFDWLHVGIGQEIRTTIKDIGAHNWNDSFTVPALAARPKLGPGEKRTVSIDTSGARGTDGAKSVSSINRTGGDRDDPGSGTIRAKEITLDSRERTAVLLIPDEPRAKPRNEPRLDPAIVKAVVGHMYVVHVVNTVSDFYALFRVDALENLTCTVSWKLIPTPQ